MSIEADIRDLNTALESCSPEEAEKTRSLVSAITVLVSDKDLENGIPPAVKKLAGDIVMEAMSLYGFMGANAVRKAFNDALKTAPLVRAMIPDGVF